MIRAPTFNTPKQSYTACLASCSGTSRTMTWPCGVHREKYIRDYRIIYCTWSRSGHRSGWLTAVRERLSRPIERILYCRWWCWSRKEKNCCWWEKIWLESPRSMQRTKAKLHYKRRCLPGMNQNDNDVATWSPQGKYIRDYHILYIVIVGDGAGVGKRSGWYQLTTTWGLGEGSCMDLQYAIFYEKIYFPWLPL